MDVFTKFIFGYLLLKLPHPWETSFERVKEFSVFDLWWDTEICHCTWDVPIVVERIWPCLAVIFHAVFGLRQQAMWLSDPYLLLRALCCHLMTSRARKMQLSQAQSLRFYFSG